MQPNIQSRYLSGQYLSRHFWAALALLTLYLTRQSVGISATNINAALIVIAVSLVPAYLWCHGRVTGLPIFPLFSLTYIWTYGLQFLSDVDNLAAYTDADLMRAVETVAIFIGAGTLSWAVCSRVKSRPRTIFIFEGEEMDAKLLGGLTGVLCANVCLTAGWLPLPPGVLPIARSTMVGAASICLLLLGYLSGGEMISRPKRLLLAILATLNCIVSASSLFLVGGFGMGALYVIGLALGRKSIPWVPIILLLFAGSFLHLGKWEIREKYWTGEGQGHFVSPLSYPALYTEWIAYSIDGMSAEKEGSRDSLLKRSSLLRLLLFVQSRTPSQVPFLRGQTYMMIPQTIVPRILNPDKLSPHEATMMLNEEFGVQDRDAAIHTSIGWGLMQEAYANFGLQGCALVGALIGAFAGMVGALTFNFPLFSLRTFLGLLTLGFSLQVENCSPVIISAYLQAVMPVVCVALVLMRRTELTSVHSEESPPVTINSAHSPERHIVG